jgi:hypothetical protein
MNQLRMAGVEPPLELMHPERGVAGPRKREQAFKVPRFLLDDLARYRRALTVDFAQKRRLRDRNGWVLQTAKLRMSRKLLREG